MACTAAEARPKTVAEKAPAARKNGTGPFSCGGAEEAATRVATPAMGGRRRDQMAGVTTAQVRSGLRVVTAAWMLGICCMLATNGWPLAVTSGATMAVFGQQIGFRDFHFGLLVMLPFLGTLAQLPASYLVERRRNRKALFLTWMTHNRWPWVLVAISPFVLPRDWVPVAVLVLIGMMAVCGGLGSPAWVSWMADFVPRRSRGRYFALRAQFAMVVLVLATLGVGLWLDRAERQGAGALLATCSAILIVAAVVGTLDIRLFHWVPEPKMTPAAQRVRWRELLSVPLGDRSYRKLVAHNMMLTLGLAMMGPFLMLHCLNALDFSKLKASMILGVMPPLGFVLASRYWGRAIDRWGRKPVLSLTILLSCAAACGWFVGGPGDVWFVAVVCLLTGVFWSGMETANFNLILEYTGSSRPNGSSYQALVAVTMSVAGLAGGLLAGTLAELLAGATWRLGPIHLNNYMVLLAISVIIRLIDLVFLVGRIEDAGAVGTRTAVRRMIAAAYRTVSMRVFDSLRGRTQLRKAAVPVRDRASGEGSG